jgi:hypothetical protein
MKTISYKIHRYVYVRSSLNRINYHMPTANGSLTISVKKKLNKDSMQLPYCWFPFSKKAPSTKVVYCWIDKIAQLSVNLSVKCTPKYFRNVLITYWIYKNCSTWDLKMLSAQLTMLWYRSTNWLAGFNLKIPFHTRERSKLVDFWAISILILYTRALQ